MSKTTAPLISFDARGSLAKTVVYSSWRGVSYARRHVIPGNPRTVAQQFNRLAFSTLREMWKFAPALVWAPWNTFATGRPFTGMNAFIGENRRAINTEADMQEFIGSPGAKGGLPAEAMDASTGSSAGEIDVDFTVPTPPASWVLQASVAAAFPDQAPDSRFGGPWSVAEITSAPWDHTLTGLPDDTLCVVVGWLRWLKPDGFTAYGVSISTTATSGS